MPGGARLGGPLPSNLLTGLQAYWAMEANANDSVAGHNGTNVGSISYGAGSGKVNNGMSITGTTSMITLASLSGLIGTTAFSVGGWVNSSATGQRYIACVDAVDYPNNYGGWSLLQQPAGQLTLVVGKNLNSGFVQGIDLQQVISTTVITLNTWYHVLGTYDGLNIRIYVNGALENTVAWVAGLGWAGTNYGRIGAERVVVFGTTYDPYNVFGQNPFQGYIDELGIWNRALSGPEASILYNAGVGRTYPFVGAP